MNRARVLKTIGAVAISLVTGPALAQYAPPAPDWSAWKPLVGEWQADPTGANGPRGGFTLAPELDGRVLVRKNFAEYPKSGDRPASRHDDLMIVYRENSTTRADYWDNEGHVIRYAVTVEKKTFTFISDAVANQPRFRLSYAFTADDALAITFEIAPPNAPDRFKPYIRATAHRKR